MPRTFVLTVAVCVWGALAAVALADKGGEADKTEKARLLEEIAHLKATVAKLQATSARQQGASQEEGAIAEKYRAMVAQARERTLFRLRGDKHPHSPHREAMEKLESIRAAVKHLNAAGLKDVAAAVAKRGDQLQAELEKSPGPGRPFKGEKPRFFKGDKPQHFKGGPPPFKGPQPPHFQGSPFHKPADGALNHQLHEMSTAISRLSKQVEQLQKAVGELQKRR